MRRVVITGCGVVCPLGSDLESVWRQVSEAKSAIGPLTKVRMENNGAHVAAEIKDFNSEQHFTDATLALMDRFAQYAVFAARAARADAALSWDEAEAPRVGVSIGSGYGGAESYDASYRALYADKITRVHPLTIPRLMHNAAAGHITMDLHAKGPSLCVATACASSTHAIGEAFRAIQVNVADVMLAGGSDAPITFGVLKSWEGLRVFASGRQAPSEACRPFSLDREGMVIGEGAAVLVLEELDHALRRGAKIYAELAGYGATSDASHITQPSVEGPARAMAFALREAGIGVDQVDYINAHGTGTRLNDAAETRAIREVFGANADAISVSSTKSMHGHMMGASGAVELLITLLGIQNRAVPPTANFRERDPECDLDYTPNRAKPRDIRVALSNSFAFGGSNAVLAVKRLD